MPVDGAPWYAGILACPDCGSTFHRVNARFSCHCGYSREFGRPLDLRPDTPRPRTVEWKLGSTAAEELSTALVERPIKSYEGPRTSRDSSELFSAIADRLRPGATFLDVGQGDSILIRLILS